MKLDPRPRGSDADDELVIAPMADSDVRDVLRIEEQAFSTTWPANAFYQELHDNKLAHYYVGRVGERLVSYGGIWVILEDSHITTIAVHPQYRGRRYGEIMLMRLLDEAIARGASWMTLEVRESNDVAQALYRKYGFTTVSTRRGYYSDNNESALVMWAGNLKSEIYENRLRALRAALP
ncbi:MAG TPA: ribosomal protein S18-alanine N-acetyltransferase [Candidatus Rubrimentiphilum sp.]|nr:ribosomal protein S18-alanine N-acetyltransferase [Candidatus Rubrimentiphilum sp.]